MVEIVAVVAVVARLKNGVERSVVGKKKLRRQVCSQLGRKECTLGPKLVAGCHCCLKETPIPFPDLGETLRLYAVRDPSTKLVERCEVEGGLLLLLLPNRIGRRLDLSSKGCQRPDRLRRMVQMNMLCSAGR